MAKQAKKESLVWIIDIDIEPRYIFTRVLKSVAKEKNLQGYRTQKIARETLSQSLQASQGNNG